MKPNKMNFNRPLPLPFAGCGNCLFFFGDGGEEDQGECRRYPPSFFPGSEKHGTHDTHIQPYTDFDSWCGEWRCET